MQARRECPDADAASGGATQKKLAKFGGMSRSAAPDRRRHRAAVTSSCGERQERRSACV